MHTISSEINILGVRLLNVSKGKVIRRIKYLVQLNKKFLIVSINPEQILASLNFPKYRTVLNKAEVRVNDSVGLSIAADYLSRPLKDGYFKFFTAFWQGINSGLRQISASSGLNPALNVIKGRILFMELIKLADRNSWKVVLIGNKAGSGKKAADKLSAIYKRVIIVPLTGPDFKSEQNESGAVITLTAKDVQIEKEIVNKVNTIKPQLLFAGFGAPVQELWLNRMRHLLKVNGMMGVGGTFDYISGIQKLPPVWIEKRGLEWLWRLFFGNQNIRRIWNASVVFPGKIFRYKLASVGGSLPRSKS